MLEAEKACRALVKKLEGDTDEDEEEEEDDEEGEDLCNVKFSLGYGGKILLNNARLHLKRNRRYGLCGHNGCGKSTLMKAMATGKLDGFPPPDELRTVYVAHDLDASEAEHSVVDLLANDPLIKGVSREEICRVLSTMGFDEERQQQTIAALSGGWKMKLSLGRAMLMKADILLLDEPTNHMDVTNVAWLENYLNTIQGVSSIIVSHDSGFLDNVCTDIIHYEKRKLIRYKGNLSEFVKQKPEAKAYYDLNVVTLKFLFPTPKVLDGILRRDMPIVRLKGVEFTYEGADKPQLTDVNVQCTMESRVAVLGPNGAGKSTLIKILTGQYQAQKGTVWRHPNLGIAYVAQHAFHHVEEHMEMSPSQYICWRYETGEDKEEQNKVTRRISKEEQRQMEKMVIIRGEKRNVEKLVGRRKYKKTYEYEVKWVGMHPVHNAWMTRAMLEEMGFQKMIHEVDAQMVAKLGLYNRPLTIAGVQQHLSDFGLEPEFGTYGQIKNLSGGQKVKVVLAAAMWANPHMIVLDEPTNYLDREALGALATALKEYQGAVVVISHNRDFMTTVCTEEWHVGGGKVIAEGNSAYETAKRKAEKEAEKAAR
jgi:elongation factor 3